MNSKPNDIVALEWLVPLIDEQLGVIHEAWQGMSSVEATAIAKIYHEVANVFKVANLKSFAALAYALAAAHRQLTDDQSMFERQSLQLQRAGRLLRQQINQYVLPDPHQELLLALKCRHIQALCRQHEVGTDVVAEDMRISHALSKVTIKNASDGKMADLSMDVCSKRWSAATAFIKEKRTPISAEMASLVEVARVMCTQSVKTADIQLWRLVGVWLANALQEKVVLTDVEVALLSDLGRCLSGSVGTALALENLIVDSYVAMSCLPKLNAEAQALLSASVAGDGHQLFFAHVLKMLECVLFELSTGHVCKDILQRIQVQMAERGWCFYEGYVKYLLGDIDAAAGDVGKIQRQLSTQVQDLYNTINNTHQIINDKIGKRINYAQPLSTQSDKELHHLRFLMGMIKNSFNEYLKTKMVVALPAATVLDEMKQAFDGLGMDERVATRLQSFFVDLRAAEMTRIAQSFADEVVHALAALDEMVDRLAEHVLDDALIDKMLAHLEMAEALIGKSVSDADLVILAKPHLDVAVRYDDSGEILPVQASTSGDKQPHVQVDNCDLSTAVAAVAHSEAYLKVQAMLKEDDFSHDEDIRAIFIEEADEVIANLQVQMPVWQTDPSKLKSLGEIRRSFHTLKGSGRMVGALQVGELAWAIESMMNRTLDGSLKPSHEMVAFVQEVVAILPVLVNDFAHKCAPTHDVATLILKAKNLVAGRSIDEGVPATVPTSAMAQQVLPNNETAITEPFDDITAEVLAEAVALDEVITVADEDEIELPEVLSPFIEEASKPIVSTVGEVDEDIRAIFVEEAEEVLSEIVPMFAIWQEGRKDKALLVDIRRGFHTLKGSGRMVGAAALGELAWSIENMLNRVLNDSIAMDAGMIALVSDVLSEFPKLVVQFKMQVDKYPEYVRLWMACAHAYSKGCGDEFDYRIFSCFAEQHGVNWSLDVDDEKALHFEAKQQAVARPIVDALNSIHEAGEIISNATLSTPRDEEEEQLCGIFIEEARELLDGVRDFLSANKNKQHVPVSDEIVRAFHTLRGASGLPPLVVVSDVGALIEKSLQGLQQHEAMMSATHLAALESSVQLIESHLTTYEAHLSGEICDDTQEDKLEEDRCQLEHLLAEDQVVAYDDGFDITVLIDDIETLLDADIALDDALQQGNDSITAYADSMLEDIEKLRERTTASSKFQRLLTTLSGAYQLLSKHPQEMKQAALMDDVLRCHDDLTGLFDAIAGSMSLRLSDAVDVLDAKVAEIEALYDTQQVSEQKCGIAMEPVYVALVDEAVSYEEIDADPDLLAIFLEEALLLDQNMYAALKRWRQTPHDSSLPKELLRHVQTIKGGARLAGIVGMGDLMEEAERAYEQLMTGRLSSGRGWLAIMSDVQTVLSLQIQEIKRYNRSFYAPTALSMLKDFIASKEVPDNARLALPAFAESVQGGDAVAARALMGDGIAGIGFEAYQARSWHGKIPDADILAIFLEEVEELVESGAEDFQAFRSNTGDLTALQSLQRNLHTIKGGARMVSANGIADLAHEMETVYEDLGARRRPVTRMVTQLLLACHDWIAQAIQLLKHTINPPTPTALIEALVRFTANPDSLNDVPNVSLVDELEMVEDYEFGLRAASGHRSIESMPPMKGVFGNAEEAVVSNEMIRIPSALMERMINLTGEAVINRSRIDMSMASLTLSIEEMGITIQRLADQLRRMDIELEAQILAQIDEKMLLDEGFDPLEMDQYSSLNQLSKSLSESASDLLDLKSTLLEKTRDGENLLLQLSRTHTDLQDGLMNSRMVPFSRLTPRFQRIVRQLSNELGKQVELMVINGDDELDKTILERITSPLEHMLRNAIDHGIERPEERDMMGKSKTGHIVLEVVREGTEVLVHLSDDGAGINVDAVRKKAISQGLISANDDTLTDLDIMQYIFNAGLSTTNAVTQISGRGVGMDVVRTEIRQLGGTVAVASKRGQGSRFTMRVPLTVAVADTLVVRAADRQYAIPLVQIERIVQADPKALIDYYRSNKNTFELEGVEYRLRYLNELLSGHNFTELLSAHTSVPVIIIKNQTGQNLALQVDQIVGSRIEVVVKPLGRQLSHVAGISAATIMGDGSVMFILDLMALIRNAQARVAAVIEQVSSEKRPVIMVVDDSVTVRKVTSRFLDRQGFDTVVAKDGVDAIEILQELSPDLMLLDIEMPRMDGFEVASQVRHNARLKDLPIIMITSRSGEKHREHAFDIGVNDYMGKPFQENELLMRIRSLLDYAPEGDDKDELAVGADKK